jgi:hypothetical protein
LFSRRLSGQGCKVEAIRGAAVRGFGHDTEYVLSDIVFEL